MCVHNAEGAMGVMINRPLEAFQFDDLLQQLNIQPSAPLIQLPLHHGGPVETSRGFIVHTDDYRGTATHVVRAPICLSATVDVVRDIVHGRGPEKCLLALGYAGWSAQQLEGELATNGWLIAEPSVELVFNTPADEKWSRALQSMGIHPVHFHEVAGSA